MRRAAARLGGGLLGAGVLRGERDHRSAGHRSAARAASYAGHAAAAAAASAGATAARPGARSRERDDLARHPVAVRRSRQAVRPI